MSTQLNPEVVKEILNSPQALTYLEELKEFLDAEQKKRKDFYEQVTDEYKAEFINGEIIMHSPVVKKHNEITTYLVNLLFNYVHKHDLGFVGYEKIMVRFTRNDYEPDLCFFGKEKAALFTDKQTLFPTPDLIVEVLSDGTKERDRGIKFQDYQAHEVAEYWIVDPESEMIEQYFLDQDGLYQLQVKSGNGELTSLAIKGFKMPIRAAFDPKANVEFLQRILK